MIPPQKLPLRINGFNVVGTFEYFISVGGSTSCGHFYITEDMLEELQKLRDRAEKCQLKKLLR